LDFKIDFLNYLGMFGRNSGCDWGVDRRKKHILEADSLPVEIARVLRRQLDILVQGSCVREDQSQSSVSKKAISAGQCVLRSADVRTKAQ